MMTQLLMLDNLDRENQNEETRTLINFLIGMLSDAQYYRLWCLSGPNY